MLRPYFDGSHIKTSIDDSKNNLLLLNLSIKPNPVSEYAIINYSIIRDGQVLIEIYDILGNKVQTLIDNYNEAGQHSVLFKAEVLPELIYFCQMKFLNEVKTVKIVVIR
jgi:serine protease AprX